jgi:Ca2+-binding RTX toxin-like protein
VAFGSYSAEVDFRQFDISTAWAARFSSAFGSGGSFPFASITYDSSYTLNFERPDLLDGHLRIYGDSFVQNGSGNLSAGIVRAVVGSFTEGISTAREYYITGASISAATFHNAMRTRSLVDDQAVLRSIFSGNDVISLSSFADFAYGADGNDTVYGNGGTDVMFGGPGADVLQGGVGNDTLTGGGGVDIFEFRTGDGNDRVLDWVDGTDELRFYGPPSSITVNINELAGGDVRLTVLGMQIIVENAVLADFQLETGSGYVSIV